jgi:hypothetical protein
MFNGEWISAAERNAFAVYCTPRDVGAMCLEQWDAVQCNTQDHQRKNSCEVQSVRHNCWIN